LDARCRGVDALETLAGVVVDLGGLEDAARLFGAAAAIREETGYRRCVSERDADLVTLEEALGRDGIRAALGEGRKLPLNDAVAYAQKGRGERKRPDTGWASLTPAEVKVAGLVADGLSNADIGKRLLCSTRTVQAHLTHIYAKLGASSRTELAAETFRQQS
jgi:DNA-binding CsgD family transcriptional regulator